MKTDVVGPEPGKTGCAETADRLNRPDQAVCPTTRESTKFTVGVATGAERENIYRARHDVYARELGQHAINGEHRLQDNLDDVNTYLAAYANGKLAGFVSLTPPSAGRYSIDKYFDRSVFPFTFDSTVYEIRLLTVLQAYRGGELASLLMYAALRWIESHGGTRIIAIGRREVADMYVRSGLKPFGLSTRSGAVTYDLMSATTDDIRQQLNRLRGLLDRIESRAVWNLPFRFRQPASCFHGGAFFAAIGERFDSLQRYREIINADVLDAWFPPSPKVLSVLREHLPWLLKTSPPTACHGLAETIAQARGVRASNILPGAGSSDLIFRALRHWLGPDSHALILDPTYGEYAHVLERVIGCTVDRLPLSRENDYAVDPGHLENALHDGYDLVVLVNPNSPTGKHIPRPKLEAILRNAPARTRIWLDETYVEYAGREESLERFAARSENVVVCKSMSKVYALSGARVAYLCAPEHQLEELRAITPPWVVSLPAQVAAVAALQDNAYYAARYQETHELRKSLAAALGALGLHVVPGVANFLLVHLPGNGPDAAWVVNRCESKGLFIRNARLMGSQMGERTLRIAVKDHAAHTRMVEILEEALSGGSL